MVRSLSRAQPRTVGSVSSGCSPPEGEDKEVGAEAAAAAAAESEERQSRPCKRVRALGLRLQSFCLSL